MNRLRFIVQAVSLWNFHPIVCPSLCDLVQELPVKKGCLVEVLKEEPSGWVLAQLHGLSLFASGLCSLALPLLSPPPYLLLFLSCHAAAEHEVCDPNAKIGWLPGSYLEKVIPTTRIAEKSQRPNDVAHSTQGPLHLLIRVLSPMFCVFESSHEVLNLRSVSLFHACVFLCL